MDKIKQRRILINRDKVVAKKIAKQVILLNKPERCLYELNNIASFIWLKANGKVKVKDIIKEICQRYEVKPDTAEKDTVEFVNDCVKKGVLVLV